MKQTLLKAAAPFAIVALLGAPLLAGAQIYQPPTDTGISDIDTLLGYLCTILGYIFGLLLLLAVIFVLYAAFKYLTAGGDAEKVSTANHMLMYAAIAVVVAILARALIPIISNFFGGGASNAC